MEKSRYRLLAIDDNTKVLDAYTTLFHQDEGLMESILALSGVSPNSIEEDDEEFEFEVECRESGQLGVELVRQALVDDDPFAVIFLDMRMPNGWSGLETAVQIRKLDEHVRIVLVSAYTDYTLKEIRSEIGPRFVFHSKPWSDDELKQLTRLLVSDWGYERELRQVQRQLEDATEEAVRANRSKDQFLASMSHELRTPLTAMLGYGELLQDTVLEQEQRALLKSMQVSGSSLLYLLNDILDLSKISAGKFEIDNTLFDLATMVREVEQIFAVRAESQGLRFEVIRSGSGREFSHMLLGDSKRIGQILINLIGNAIKFTRDGFVHLEVYSEQKKLHLKVVDSGIGMGPEVIERLFKPFEQADRSISGRFGGTGLGLHISHTLARLMGGEITVESEQGKGSTFEVVVPLVMGQPIKVRHSDEQGEAGAQQFEGQVLVAEDTPELQLLIRKLIEPTGAQVDIAENGEQAFQRAMAQPYDLIFMDMQMPVMDGLEATRLLRSSLNKTPVVALTANVMQHQREAFEEAGCNGFLSKPIKRKLLMEALAQYLTAVEGEESGHQVIEVAATKVATPERMNEIDDELRALFFERVKELKQELIEVRELGELKEIRALVHNIKGSISSFGYMDVYETAAEAEQRIDEEDDEAANRLMDLLNGQLADILHP